jgi:hypothetical protein
VSKYGWFYYSCTTKAADPKQSYTCKCGEVVPEPIPRYFKFIVIANANY